jgi:glycosyltransferase involved in cell wall biosynthesis
MTEVHVVAPDSIDDPARPSGGNAYDRRIFRGLTAAGWTVREHAVSGPWPRRDGVARAGLAGLISTLPDGAVVLIDGLIACTAPEVLEPESMRLRLVVLVHMPLGGGAALDAVADDLMALRARERAVLSAAAAVITTSGWTRRQLLDWYGLRPSAVHVAEPGVDAAGAARGTAGGGELLCVAAVTPHKGHDVLLGALATVADLPWRCVCIGTLSRDPSFVGRLIRRAREDGIGDRVRFAGPLAAEDVGAAYAAADVLVLASHAETYGMVVTEALARGLPVVATAVGGVPGALGFGAAGSRPGLLVRPGDPVALAAALRAWLVDADLRQRLREAAEERRAKLSAWSVTVDRVARVLDEVARAEVSA